MFGKLSQWAHNEYSKSLRCWNLDLVLSQRHCRYVEILHPYDVAESKILHKKVESTAKCYITLGQKDHEKWPFFVCSKTAHAIPSKHEEIGKEHTTISGPDFRWSWYADYAFLSYIEEIHVNILPEPRSTMFLASKALYQVIFSTLTLSPANEL